MFLEVQMSTSRLSDLIRNGVEREIMARDIGLNGLIANVPFFTNIFQLINNTAVPSMVAVDHIRLTNIQLFRGSGMIPVSINVPPLVLLPFLPVTPPGPSTQTINIRSTQISVTFEVYLVRRDDMVAANGNAVADDNQMVIQCRANFTIPPLAISGSTLSITPSVIDVELGVIDLFIRLPPADELADLTPPEQLDLFRRANPILNTLTNANLSNLFNVMQLINSPTVLRNLTIPPIPLNISGVNSVLASLPGPNGVLQLWNAGLSMRGALVVVRMQAAPTGLTDIFVPAISTQWIQEWTNFYTSGSTNRLGVSEWGIFLPSGIFVDTLHKNIVDGIAADTRVELSGGAAPRSEWQIVDGTPDAGGPCSADSTVRVITRFAIFVPGACEPLGLGLDVNVQLTTLLSLRAGSVLRADLHVDFGVDEGDIAGCAILNSLLTSAAGFVIGGTFGGFIGAAIIAAVGGLVGGIATLVVGYTYNPGELSLGDRLHAVPGADRDFYLEVPIEADLSLNSARMEIQGMAACPDGLCIRGRFIIREIILFLADDITLPQPFSWAGMGLCTAESIVHAATFFQWDLERTRVGFDNMPLVLFRFNILDANPFEFLLFSLSPSLEHTTGMVLTLSRTTDQAISRTQDILDAGIDDAFLEVFIQTNVGARIVRFNHLDGSLTRETLAAYNENRERFCALLEMGRRARREPSMFMGLLDRINVQRTLTILPMLGARVLSFWTVMANGLNAGDLMRIGRVATAMSSETNFFHDFQVAGETVAARVIEYAHKDESCLTVQLLTNTDEGILSLHWQYFYEAARIPFVQKCIDFAVERVDGETYLALLTPSGLTVYNITLTQPRLVFSHLLAGMQQFYWQKGALVIDGANQAAYYPELNQILIAPDQTAKSTQLPTRRRHRVIDDQGHWLISETFGRLALIQYDQERYISVYERVDQKEPDLLLE